MLCMNGRLWCFRNGKPTKLVYELVTEDGDDDDGIALSPLPSFARWEICD
jgi:hypothetical protein